MTTHSQRYALLGIRLPLSGTMSNGRVIVDADGDAIAMVLPCHSADLERERAQVLVAALNRLLAEDAEQAERSAA